MIRSATEFLKQSLNEYIASRDAQNFGNPANGPVIITGLLDQKNEFLFKDATQPSVLLMTVINLEEETVGKSQLPYYKTADDLITVLNPDIKLNFYLLLTAYSKDTAGAEKSYINALNLIDHSVFFFQFRNVFTHKNTPALPDDIERLVAEPMSLTLEQLNHLWATLGAKHMPSILYKIRLLTYRDTTSTDSQPRIEKISATANIS